MSYPPPLALRSSRVVLPAGVRPATVHLREGRIARIDDDPDARDLGDRVLMPGLVDTHVHVNEPGRTTWEGFATATAAAAAGGVTTLVDMPLNSIPATTTVASLHAKRAAAAGKCRVDVGFWGGVVPGNSAELPALWRAGVLGFKCFMVPSGVDEFPHVSEADLRGAMPVLAALGAPLLVHAELPGPILAAAAGVARRDPREYATWLASRPHAAEVEAVEMMLRLCREFGGPVHIVHVASPEVLPLLAEARAAGLPVTAETCPHYLFFAAEEIADGATRFKCAPPIRDAASRDRLWQGLREGTLDLIATDHSPCPPELKGMEAGDFFTAWGGIASLQLGLAATWTAASARGCTPAQMSEWMCSAPARLAGIGARKGRIEVGMDADLVVWDPETSVAVDPARLLHRYPVTPYENRLLSGIVEETYVRGARVYEGGGLVGEPIGRMITRGEG